MSSFLCLSLFLCVLHSQVLNQMIKCHENWIRRCTNGKYLKAVGFLFTTFGNHNVAGTRICDEGLIFARFILGS
jgi:hypothetical protein